MSDVTVLQIVLANFAIMAGACLQGVAGYGIGTLSAPLMFLISPLFLPGPLTLNAVILTIMMLVRNRASLSFSRRRSRSPITGLAPRSPNSASPAPTSTTFAVARWKFSGAQASSITDSARAIFLVSSG